MASAILIPHRAFDSVTVSSVLDASRKDHLEKYLTELQIQV
ncbi:hypothetical protein [Burkholderia lata]|nr:hypothetical protein [Burkholderia lata]